MELREDVKVYIKIIVLMITVGGEVCLFLNWIISIAMDQDMELFKVAKLALVIATPVILCVALPYAINKVKVFIARVNDHLKEGDYNEHR